MDGQRFGNFELLSKIGQGAMGEVYRARDTVLNREVAVKTILATMGGDDTLRKRFLREAQSAAGLNHPNIITVYDFGESHGRLYMAMELLEGQDLKQAIATGQLGDLDAKLGVLEQIAEGLSFAHQHEVIHRDLKPANVHLQPDGQVKIVDFGLAKLSGSEMTRTGMIMGTPHYMSPEQVRGEKVDARSDVFSLGCIFYEILTSKKPFDSDSMHAVLFKVLQEEPVPVRTVLPDLPLAVEQVLERCLAKDPAQRFQNAAELHATLQRVRAALASGQGAEPLPGLPLPAPAAAQPSRSPTARPATLRPGARPRSGSVPPVSLAGSSTATKGLLLAGLALGAVLLGVVIAFFAMRGGGRPSAPSPSAPVDGLARALAGTQAELARKKLESGDLAEAARQAERALGLDPENAEALKVKQRAEALLVEREGLQRAAREAGASGDGARAVQALWQLMLVEPEGAAVAELAPLVESRFQGHAEEARRLAQTARSAAEQAGFSAVDAYRDGQRLLRESETASQARRWATAAARALAARQRFVRAKPSAQS